MEICEEILLALFELRSSNNGGSPITPLTLVSILPSINQSEKCKKIGNGPIVKHLFNY
jgi:hypothetical protein